MSQMPAPRAAAYTQRSEGQRAALIMTDKQRIRQVMDNYTYNAIKYAAENVRIVVSASAPFSRSEAAQWARHGSSELGTVSSTTAGLEHPPCLPSVGSGQRQHRVWECVPGA